MHTHPGEGEGTLLSVSNGRDLWQAERLGQGAWENVSRIESVRGVRDHERPNRRGSATNFFRGRTSRAWPRFCAICSTAWCGRGSESIRQAEPRTYPSGRRLVEGGSAAAGLFRGILADRRCRASVIFISMRAHTGRRRVEWWGPSTTGAAIGCWCRWSFAIPSSIVRCRPRRVLVCSPSSPATAEIEDETATVTAEMTRPPGELTQASAAR